MPTTAERAAAGHEKAMKKLFEANKNRLYAFCSILLEDDKRASEAARGAMNGIWAGLRYAEVKTDEEFSHLLMLNAAEQCRLLLFGKDTKAFKISKTEQTELPEIGRAEYTGSASDGICALQNALKSVEPQQRYIFLLHTAGNLSFKEIAQVIRQREAVAKYYCELAVLSLLDNFASDKNAFLQAEQVKSLLEQALESTAMPAATCEACTAQIKASAKAVSPLKKILLAVAGLLLCVIAVLVWPKGGIVDTAGSSSPASAAESSGYTPTALDGELTYYADIAIENYGTVTVKLDQGSAPISAANFVTLAEDGFYNGLTFHRIIDGFMMQGGDPNGNGTGGSENTIAGEFADNGYENNLSHTRGAISMARSSDYNSASSQFFIVHKDSTSLDGQYAVFGYVTDGMEIVDKICESAEPTDNNGTIEAEAQPVISSVTIRTE